MPLTVNAAASCKNIFVILNYTSIQTQTFSLDVTDGTSSILSVPNPTFTIPPNSGPISYPIPLSDLSISNGVVNVVISLQGTAYDEQAVLIHCDIDCCLSKLTNELITCSCDCAKCASSLAKAQKVFLLLKSADYAIVQANDAVSGLKAGFLQDAISKYLKAKEVCDDSCGCNC
mgnify:FL=1|tara:strand:+ start:143 stop:664 length:522 start_codon:yes stop_codon:yes gene_type:complete